MRVTRCTTLQMLLSAALIALMLGMVAASSRGTVDQLINQVAFSPGGKFLAAKYSGGAVQVWRLDTARPRLVAQAFGGPALIGYDASSIQFLSDDKLLELEPQFAAGSIATVVRELTIST